jgi:hypothetical protein
VGAELIVVETTIKGFPFLEYLQLDWPNVARHGYPKLQHMMFNIFIPR